MIRTLRSLSALCLSACIGAMCFPPSASAGEFKMHEGFRNKRYGEIILVTGGPFRFVGHVYNTVGLNDCPQNLWDKLDTKRIAPDGCEYVMQTYALIADKTLKASDLPGLGKKLKLPEGWNYRMRIPEKDLILTTSGSATVLQDDLMNTYQLIQN